MPKRRKTKKEKQMRQSHSVPAASSPLVYTTSHLTNRNVHTSSFVTHGFLYQDLRKTGALTLSVMIAQLILYYILQSYK